MFLKSSRPRYIRCGLPEWDEQEFALDDPRIPAVIREDIHTMAGPGWTVFFADTDLGGEWWLFDANGELAEAFWIEE